MKNPASGVMLQLTNYGMTEIVSDTVVMNNRGYWQLRGNMGVYEVSVSKDSPGKALVSENGTLWLTKPVGERINLQLQIFQWNHLEENIPLKLTTVEIEKKEPKVESLADKLKSKFFTSKHSHIGEAIDELANESDEEQNQADF